MIWKQVAHTTYHQLLAAQHEPFSAKYWRILQDLYEKTLSLAKNTGEFYAKKSGEQTIRGEKKTRQKEQLNWVK